MSVLSQLNAVCDVIRPHVTVPVMVGRPDSSIPGLYVWPWRLEVKSEWSNRPPRPSRPEAASPVSDPILNTRLLLLPIPALDAESLASLENAQLVLHDHPLLTVNGAQLRVAPETPLSVAELSSLFIAAQLPLSLCAAFVLSVQSPTVA